MLRGHPCLARGSFFKELGVILWGSRQLSPCPVLPQPPQSLTWAGQTPGPRLELGESRTQPGLWQGSTETFSFFFFYFNIVVLGYSLVKNK